MAALWMKVDLESRIIFFRMWVGVKFVDKQVPLDEVIS